MAQVSRSNVVGENRGLKSRWPRVTQPFWHLGNQRVEERSAQAQLCRQSIFAVRWYSSSINTQTRQMAGQKCCSCHLTFDWARPCLIGAGVTSSIRFWFMRNSFTAHRLRLMDKVRISLDIHQGGQSTWAARRCIRVKGAEKRTHGWHADDRSMRLERRQIKVASSTSAPGTQQPVTQS